MSSPISGRNPFETMRTNKEKANVNGASKVTTRNEAKRTGTNILTQYTKEDINNAIDGRRYLEKHLLLCPPGEPITTAALATCLHQISKIGGSGTGPGKMMTNAVRAAAFLAEEIEENSINEVVRDTFASQFNEFTADMKSLVDDAKARIDEHSQKIIDQIPTNIPSTPTIESPAITSSRRTYAETLIDPPSHADPKLAAKEGIKARQIMLEGIDQSSKISQMDSPQLKTELNNILKEQGLEGKGIRSAAVQRNKGILIEMDNDLALEWIKKQENRVPFCIEIGPDVIFKPRAHTVIAFNVPLTIDLESETHRNEILDANNIEPDTFNAIRWVKPASKRTPEQKSAHLFISFTDAKSANRIITNGLTICNKKVRAEKVKKEPIRCLKCQRWGHLTYECAESLDKCGNCAEEHRTDQCTHPQKTHCISCDSDHHASWNRRCPVYLKKVDECDSRNPENMLQFFPTTESWTWSTRIETRTNKPRVHDIHRPAYANVKSHRSAQGNTHRPSRTDSYRPTQQHDTYRPIQQHDTYRPTQQHDTYRPSQGYQWGGPSRRVDWSAPPAWSDDDLPPSKSWNDETPYDEVQHFPKTATKEFPHPSGPASAPSDRPTNA